MNWKKIGHVFAPPAGKPWCMTHAANAFAEAIDGNVFRIHFTCRDLQNRSHIAFADVELEPPFRVHRVSAEPVLAPGEPGLFDDSGCALGCIVNVNGNRRMYYLGWNLAVTVPWRNSIGLADWDERENRFIKTRRAPLLDRSDEDPFTISYPWVMQDNGVYKMWYGSNLQWGSDQSQMNHVIKYAESLDGLLWKRSREIAVNLQHENEYALSKPQVIREKGVYRMWYSYRASGPVTTYRIGYAESYGGRQFERMDHLAGIDVSESGWDSEMICYPFIFDHDGNRFMLYNGNGYGRTGFGLAVLVNDHL